MVGVKMCSWLLPGCDYEVAVRFHMLLDACENINAMTKCLHDVEPDQGVTLWSAS